MIKTFCKWTIWTLLSFPELESTQGNCSSVKKINTHVFSQNSSTVCSHFVRVRCRGMNKIGSASLFLLLSPNKQHNQFKVLEAEEKGSKTGLAWGRFELARHSNRGREGLEQGGKRNSSISLRCVAVKFVWKGKTTGSPSMNPKGAWPETSLSTCQCLAVFFLHLWLDLSKFSCSLSNVSPG